MEQLTLGDLEKFIEDMKKKHPQDYKDIPVYLGDDDEMNGIHTAWYCEEVNEENEEDEDVIEMINDNYGNVKFDKKSNFNIIM